MNMDFLSPKAKMRRNLSCLVGYGSIWKYVLILILYIPGIPESVTSTGCRLVMLLAIYAELFRFRLEKEADKVSLSAEHLKFKMSALWLSEDTCFRNGLQ